MFLSDIENLSDPEYSENDACPRCENGRLVKRYQRKLEGREFLGCSNFPRCEFTIWED